MTASKKLKPNTLLAGIGPGSAGSAGQTGR